MPDARRSEEHTSELQSPCNLVCRLLLEKKKKLKSSHDARSTNFQGDRAVHVLPPRRSVSIHGRRISRARIIPPLCLAFCFFFNDTATTEIYTLSLHDALPISLNRETAGSPSGDDPPTGRTRDSRSEEHTSELQSPCNLVCRLLLEKKK